MGFMTILRRYRAAISLFAIFVAVFGAVFALYNLPVRAVIYPALICVAIGAAALVYKIAATSAKHRMLSRFSNLPSGMISVLPEPENIIEADYQEIIRSVQSELREFEDESSRRYRDTVDYYTVWAHQIKTPIASMRLTLDGEDTPTSRRLSGELFRVEQYVEMVMAFLRLDSPSTDYVFRETELDVVIRQAVKKFAAEFIDRRLRLDFEPTGLRLVTDEKWLSFVIEQVLSNALKYTRVGSVRIYLREPQTLCIEDSGIGISPEDLPRVFEKGYTGYNGRTDKKASGLGLYLCKRVLKNLGADIRIASEPDRGTIVSIDLGQYELKTE